MKSRTTFYRDGRQLRRGHAVIKPKFFQQVLSKKYSRKKWATCNHHFSRRSYGIRSVLSV